MYPGNDYRNYLMHYGRPGMRWGRHLPGVQDPNRPLYGKPTDPSQYQDYKENLDNERSSATSGKPTDPSQYQDYKENLDRNTSHPNQSARFRDNRHRVDMVRRTLNAQASENADIRNRHAIQERHDRADRHSVSDQKDHENRLDRTNANNRKNVPNPRRSLDTRKNGSVSARRSSGITGGAATPRRTIGSTLPSNKTRAGGTIGSTLPSDKRRTGGTIGSTLPSDKRRTGTIARTLSSQERRRRRLAYAKNSGRRGAFGPR